MAINQKFLDKLAARLFSAEEERREFCQALTGGASGRETVVHLASEGKPGAFFSFVEEAAEGAGKSPAHEKGEIYCLDNSSVFAAAPLKVVKEKVSNLLDVCAAPGGKSILSWRLLKPDFLVANETINKRVPMLISNLKRCRINPCGVTTFDSRVLKEKFSEVFDVVLVDAPCSGQSLLAKGEAAPGALNPATINTNSNRQKRILANSAACVAAGGHLLYTTCTFAIDENEKVASWFLEKFPEFRAEKVPMLSDFHSRFSEFPSYRLFPQSGLGAGAYTALFKRAGEKKDLPSLTEERFIWRQD